ncbi:MAG TPA: hypothetical protein VMF13_17655 [Luteitalea sp.]|nr:hypothetical protein [Luteitalea sp.]
MTPLEDTVNALLVADPHGAWLRRMFEQLPDVHWGALRQPGRPIDRPLARTVSLVDGAFTLPCVIETDTLFVAIEDARGASLPTGTSTDPKRHHVSRCIEALRHLARERARAEGADADPLFGVVVVGGPISDDPHRTTILEGLPHIEREQAEDLYASYWGRLSPETFDALAVATAG